MSIASKAEPTPDLRYIDVEARERAAAVGLEGSLRDKLRYTREQLGLFSKADEYQRGLITARLAMLLEMPRVRRKRRHFSKAARGRRLLEQRPQITFATIEAMRALPATTLGGAYARFASARRLDPNIFPPVEQLDPERSFVFTRGVQTHDLWHVVTGIETSFRGEAVLIAVNAAQDPSFFSIGATLLGLLGTVFDEPRMLWLVARSYWRGLRARNLISTAWEDLWELPLDEVRAWLRIVPENDPLVAFELEPIEASQEPEASRG